MELNTYFEGLLSNIQPKPEFVSDAQKAHTELRERLQKDEEISKANPDSYLTGSYARDTAINDIKDVDIILLIDMDDKNTEPSVVLSWVEQSLYNYYSEVRLQGRSVQVVADNGVNLDVVPAVAFTHRDGPLVIPDREVRIWVATHPKGQINFSVRRNQSTEGYYKQLVKIMKFWRDRLSNSSAQPKSYVLETLVSEFIFAKPRSYANAVVDIMEGIKYKYSAFRNSGGVPIINDPGYSQVNVAKRWTHLEFIAFLDVLETSCTIAKAALNETDEAKSIQLWRKLFGSKFEENV